MLRKMPERKWVVNVQMEGIKEEEEQEKETEKDRTGALGTRSPCGF